MKRMFDDWDSSVMILMFGKNLQRKNRHHSWKNIIIVTSYYRHRPNQFSHVGNSDHLKHHPHFFSPATYPLHENQNNKMLHDYKIITGGAGRPPRPTYLNIVWTATIVLQSERVSSSAELFSSLFTTTTFSAKLIPARRRSSRLERAREDVF